MSSFSIGQMNQLGKALERAGFTARDITMLGQFSKLRDIRTVLHGHRRIVEPEFQYPGWVIERLTPGLEATSLRDPGETRLWLDPQQTSSNKPTGHEVYEAIKANGLLEKSLSFGDLKWYEANPDYIPTEWLGSPADSPQRQVYGWASVVSALQSRTDLSLPAPKPTVPFLHYYLDVPHVDWNWLDNKWNNNQFAGLRKVS